MMKVLYLHVLRACREQLSFCFFFFTFVFRLPPSDFPVLFPEFCFLFYVSYDWFLSTVFFLLIFLYSSRLRPGSSSFVIFMHIFQNPLLTTCTRNYR